MGTTGTGNALTRFTGTGTVLPTSTSFSAVFAAGQPVVLISLVSVVTGVLTDFVAQTAIAGATVTIGTLPNASTCGPGWAGCGTALAPTYTAVTQSNGSFSVAGVPNTGSYFLTIGVDANPTVSQTYTILHCTIAVSAANGVTNLGTLNISKLSSDEAAWLKQLNTDRATISYPATGPTVMDEYSEEGARDEAAAVANGTDPFSDATETLFADQVLAQPGTISYGWRTVDAESLGPGEWNRAESAYFSEKANCPNATGAPVHSPRIRAITSICRWMLSSGLAQRNRRRQPATRFTFTRALDFSTARHN